MSTRLNFAIQNFQIPTQTLHVPADAPEGEIPVAIRCASLYKTVQDFQIRITDFSNRSVVSLNLNCLQPIYFDMSNPNSATFNEDGRFLAFAIENTLAVLNITDMHFPTLTAFVAEQGAPFTLIKMHNRQDAQACLIAANILAQIAILDLVSNQTLAILQSSDIINIAINQEGTRLLSLDREAHLHYWNLQDLDNYASPHIVKTARLAHRISAMAQSPNGTRIATLEPGNRLGLWDLETALKIKDFQLPKTKAGICLFLFIDEHTIAIRDAIGKHLIVWNTENEQILSMHFAKELAKPEISAILGNIVIAHQDGRLEIYNPALQKTNTFEPIALPIGDLTAICAYQESVILM
jgi:WD40 repeat protein